MAQPILHLNSGLKQTKGDFLKHGVKAGNRGRRVKFIEHLLCGPGPVLSAPWMQSPRWPTELGERWLRLLLLICTRLYQSEHSLVSLSLHSITGRLAQSECPPWLNIPYASCTKTPRNKQRNKERPGKIAVTTSCRSPGFLGFGRWTCSTAAPSFLKSPNATCALGSWHLFPAGEPPVTLTLDVIGEHDMHWFLTNSCSCRGRDGKDCTPDLLSQCP